MPSNFVSISSWAVAMGLLSASCTLSPGTAGTSGAGESAVGMSAAALSLDLQALLATTDIASLRFEAERVSCAGEAVTPETISRTSTIEDLALPVSNPELANQPLAPNSEHLFADKLVLLEPGCYDITITPLTQQGSPSSDCSPARRSRVQIFAEATTEIVLISQCGNAAAGAGDFVQVLNHPPALTSFAYLDSRFVQRCQAEQVCITASDPDHDPLELTWISTPASNPHFAAPIVTSTSSAADGSLRQCVSILPEQNGSYEFTVTAYDQVTSGNGPPSRVEDWLSATGVPTSSHASVTFSFVANDGQGSQPTECE